MGIWLFVHLLAAGTWLGCVLVEIAFERALAVRGQWTLLARLHDSVDRWIELPALAVVVVTGWWLLRAGFAEIDLSGWLQAKIAFGLLAVLANLYCALLVSRRHRLAESNDLDAVKHIDQLQHKVGVLVLVGLLGAIACGLVAAN